MGKPMKLKWCPPPVVVALLFLAVSSAFTADSKPNVLFICTDQQHPAIAGYRVPHRASK